MLRQDGKCILLALSVERELLLVAFLKRDREKASPRSMSKYHYIHWFAPIMRPYLEQQLQLESDVMKFTVSHCHFPVALCRGQNG